MTAIRLSLVCPGATAGELLPIARMAERYGLGCWVGDPFEQSAHADDTYVTATGAALATATEYVRIGLFLSLRGSAKPIRLAEDIGVLDQMSGGRIDLGLVPPVEGAGEWQKVAERVLNSWEGWPMADGRAPAITPPPAQRLLPVFIVDNPHLSAQMGGALIMTRQKPIQASARHSILLCHAPIGDQGIEAWLSPSPRSKILDLRAQAEAAGAKEIILVLDTPAVTERDMLMLGGVVAIGLRASAGDRDVLIEDAWNWATKRQEFHRAPPA